MAGPGNNSGGGMKFMKFSQDTNEKSETYKQCFFMMMEKQNGVWTETERFSKFEGQLVKLEFKSYEYKGDNIDTVILCLEADGITYKITMNYNYTSRSIFNSLIGNVEYIAKNPLVISTYLKDGYGNVWVGKNTGQGVEHSLGWKYKYNELPEVAKTIVGTKTITDDTKVNEFFKAWLKHDFIDSGILAGVTEPTTTDAPSQSNNLPPQGNSAPSPNKPDLPPAASMTGQPLPPQGNGAPMPYTRPQSQPDANLPDPNDDLPF